MQFEQDINKLETEYKIKLDDTQRSVLSSLISFIFGDKQCICVKASAGTGKTTILSMLYDYISANTNKTISFVTPTNKAKIVANEKGTKNNRNATTIHSLLNLKPNIEIMEFDAKNLLFLPSTIQTTRYDVLLIDECSMINDDLYNTLCNQFKNSKLIFSGDPAQLKPVNQKRRAKSFDDIDCLSLNTVHRQTDGVVYKVIDYLRRKPLRYFKSVQDENNRIVVYNDIKKMLHDYAPLFKAGENLCDPNFIKIIAYTNKRIGAINDYVRKIIYEDDDEYHKNELLTGCDSCSCGE